MKIIEVQLPVSFEEQSRLSLFYVAIEDEDFYAATDRFEKLTDPRTVNEAAHVLGAVALEEGRLHVLRDMVGRIECPKLRFGWMLEILEKGSPDEFDAEEIVASMAKELDRINDDGNFLDRAKLALDDLIEKLRAPMLDLTGHFDPDIAGLSVDDSGLTLDEEDEDGLASSLFGLSPILTLG